MRRVPRASPHVVLPFLVPTSRAIKEMIYPITLQAKGEDVNGLGRAGQPVYHAGQRQVVRRRIPRVSVRFSFLTVACRVIQDGYEYGFTGTMWNNYPYICPSLARGGGGE